MNWVRILAFGLIMFVSACQTVQPRRFTPAQATALRAQGFKETPQGWELGLGDRLLFEIDKSQVKPQQAVRLRKLAVTLRDVGIATLRVEGHADATGSAGHNQALSVDRARAVVDALAEGGLDRAGLQTLGLGAGMPIESNRTREGRLQNRRVVIIVPPQG